MKHLVAFLLIILLMFGCKKDDSNPVSSNPNGNNGNIKIGDVVDLTTQTINLNGGTVTVTKPGDPLNGLTVTIQPNSFTQAQTIKISSAPITSHQLGQYFNPLTPLIKITYQGGYANSTMRVKVPINLSNGRFAMGFFYNEQTGTLEGIPIEELASDHITIATKYFSPNSLSKKTNTDIVGDIVIGFIDESVLTSKTIIDTGFKPGVDDWEFINYGSYIRPYGICAGVSLSEMWYYIERKKMDGPLFHKFDTYNDKTQPGKLWQDNPLGYRFASVIQADINWGVQKTERIFQHSDPLLTWKAFALSMLLTKEPQYVCLISTTDVGHAVVAYQMNYQTGELYVSDPNYPAGYQTDGTTINRTIKFRGNKFDPFLSALKVDTTAVVFDTVYYFGASTMINFDKFRTRWTEVQNGTIGTIGNNNFPSYKLFVNNVGGQELTDNYPLSSDSLKVVCQSLNSVQQLTGTNHLQAFYVYDQNGILLKKADFSTQGMAKLRLGKGIIKLGFYICGAKNNRADNYVDFKWININSLGMTIDPNPLNGDINKEYTFTANVQGTQPANATKYVWNFGDGTSDVTVNGSNTAKHTYTTGGTYTVSVKLYDNSTNNVVISAASTVNILSSFTYELLATQSVEIDLTGVIVYDKYYPNSTINYIYQNPTVNLHYERNNQTITWSGLSFSINYTYKFPPFDGYTGSDTLTANGTINGSISQDGKTISNITAHEKITRRNTDAYLDFTLVIHDIPFLIKTTIGCATCVNYLEYMYDVSSSVQSKISSLNMTEKRFDSSLNQYVTMNSSSYNMAALYVYFRKKM